MNIKLTEFVIFDVETTGLSPIEGDRIVEIAAVNIIAGDDMVSRFEEKHHCSNRCHAGTGR